MTEQMKFDFEVPTFYIEANLKSALNAAAKKSKYSRQEIIDRMNDLADRYGVSLVRGNTNRLSAATFEKWLNPSDKSHHINVKALPIFVAVTGDTRPFAVIAEPCGCQVIQEEDAKLLKWAKTYRRIQQDKARLRKMEADL